MSDSCKKDFVIKPNISLTKGDKGDKGDPGQDASFSFPISTDDIDYRGNVLTDVLDALSYLELMIESFTAAVSNYENGQILTSIQLSWVFNKAVDAQSITGSNVVSPSLDISDRTKLVTLNNISSNTVITLTADDVSSDSTPAKITTTTLSFLNKLYYGKKTIGTINSAFVLSLTNELATNRLKEFTTNTGAGEYIWFASPVSMGLASFNNNGFTGGWNSPVTISFTNASGYIESYYVYRSTNEFLGITDTQVL